MQNEAGTVEGSGTPERMRRDGDALGTVMGALAPGTPLAGASGPLSDAHEAAFRASPVALAIARDPHCAVVLRNPAMNRIVPASLDWRTWRLPDGASPPLFEGGVAVPLDRQPLRLAAYQGVATTDREIELRWPGREPVLLRCSAAPLFDAAGAPSGAVVAVVDVSAAKTAQHDRARLSGAAEARGRAKDELLASMGHELRNPLNAIVTAVEVLNRAEPTAPEAHSARRIIGRQAWRLAELIGEVTDIGRALADGPDPLLAPVDLGALLARCIDRARPRAAARGQTLQPQLAPARIDGDAERLGDAIDRVLDDASRSAPEGRVIGVRLHRGDGPDGGEAIVEVGDAEALGAVDGATPDFGPRGVAGGLGIGLTLVRHIVEVHGGRIDARRHAGPHGGTVYRLRLPALDDAAAAAPAGSIGAAPGPGVRAPGAHSRPAGGDS